MRISDRVKRIDINKARDRKVMLYTISDTCAGSHSAMSLYLVPEIAILTLSRHRVQNLKVLETGQ
jgi:hypothetical protein